MFIARFYREFRRGVVIVRSAIWLLVDLPISQISGQAKSNVTGKKGLFKRFLSFLLKIIIRIFYNHRADHSSLEEFRKTLERLEPAYVKLGQMLSLRGDLPPKNLTQELAKLQNKVPYVKLTRVKKTIESELGQDTSSLFRTFDEKPMAAGSLGQVHFTELQNGRAVAVKVQRPGRERLIYQDISIIKHFVVWLEMWSNLRHYQLSEFIGRSILFH